MVRTTWVYVGRAGAREEPFPTGPEPPRHGRSMSGRIEKGRSRLLASGRKPVALDMVQDSMKYPAFNCVIGIVRMICGKSICAETPNYYSRTALLFHSGRQLTQESAQPLPVFLTHRDDPHARSIVPFGVSDNRPGSYSPSRDVDQQLDECPNRR